ncbi:MAG: hypothetical protein V1851_03190 [Patescibacteria group bacterium]
MSNFLFFCFLFKYVLIKLEKIVHININLWRCKMECFTPIFLSRLKSLKNSFIHLYSNGNKNNENLFLILEKISFLCDTFIQLKKQNLINSRQIPIFYEKSLVILQEIADVLGENKQDIFFFQIIQQIINRLNNTVYLVGKICLIFDLREKE